MLIDESAEAVRVATERLAAIAQVAAAAPPG